MYSIDLERISLDEFAELVQTADLLPGRRILLDGFPGVIAGLKRRGIGHLAALHRLLKDKKGHPALADELSVSTDYLVVLRREVNSYVSKPVPLAKLGVFSEAELNRLAEAGLKSTRDLYERALTPSARRALADRLGLPVEQVAEALELSDLLRVNGVGPVYARILCEIGIRSPADYLATPSGDLLSRYERLNEEKGITRAKLSVKDVEYCKRFCRKLDADIQG